MEKDTFDSQLQSMNSDPFGNKRALREANAERVERLGGSTVRKIDTFLAKYGIA